MSDNIRRFRSIKNGLMKLLPHKATGNFARHFETMAFMISGVIASQSCHLPKVASKVADLRKPESRVRSFGRWLSNERIDFRLYYLPFAELLVRYLSAGDRPLAVVFDSSCVGRNCIALVASIVYKKRALPVAWLVRRGDKGHFPETMHQQLAQRVEALIPTGTKVIFLGDGEFDGADLINLVKSFGWLFVCRTAKNRQLLEEGDSFSPKMLGVRHDGFFEIADISLANDASAGLLHLVVCWQKRFKDPLYLLTNIAPMQEAVFWYQKRFTIETFFSDQKGRGFHLHKSHIADPERLERLMMISSLAYIWLIFLGVLAIENGWHRLFHRTDRCDISLFQLGLRLLEYRLNLAKNIPMQLNLFSKLIKSVR